MVSRNLTSNRGWVSQIGTQDTGHNILAVYQDQWSSNMVSKQRTSRGDMFHRMEHKRLITKYQRFNRNKGAKPWSADSEHPDGICFTDCNKRDCQQNINCLPGTRGSNMISRQRTSSRGYVSQIGT